MPLCITVISDSSITATTPAEGQTATLTVGPDTTARQPAQAAAAGR